MDSHKILIAEDQETNFLLLKELLSEQNFEILWVKNGIDAVDLFKKNPDISLILMDIKMPKMNGYEATKQIRQIDANIPILALTAYAFEDDRYKAMEAGCSGYLAKPYKEEQLQELLKKFLP